jgi:methyl coenzyme M reductase subunit D
MYPACLCAVAHWASIKMSVTVVNYYIRLSDAQSQVANVLETCPPAMPATYILNYGKILH